VVDVNSTGTGEALIMRSLPLTSLLTKDPLYGNESINFKHMRNAIIKILVVTASQGLAETVYRRVPPIAQECVLSWRVKTIESSYNYGVYQEMVLETYLNTTAGPFPWVSYPSSTSKEAARTFPIFKTSMLQASPITGAHSLMIGRKRKGPLCHPRVQ
jgi:hypothetical protein